MEPTKHRKLIYFISQQLISIEGNQPPSLKIGRPSSLESVAIEDSAAIQGTEERLKEPLQQDDRKSGQSPTQDRLSKSPQGFA